MIGDLAGRQEPDGDPPARPAELGDDGVGLVLIVEQHEDDRTLTAAEPHEGVGGLTHSAALHT
jgi:hypothetical protein